MWTSTKLYFPKLISKQPSSSLVNCLLKVTSNKKQKCTLYDTFVSHLHYIGCLKFFYNEYVKDLRDYNALLYEVKKNLLKLDPKTVYVGFGDGSFGDDIGRTVGSVSNIIHTTHRS